jgi:hypothetical protein
VVNVIFIILICRFFSLYKEEKAAEKEKLLWEKGISTKTLYPHQSSFAALQLIYWDLRADRDPPLRRQGHTGFRIPREGRAPPLRRGMEAFAPVHRKTRIDRASLATEPYIPIKVLLRPFSFKKRATGFQSFLN